MHINNTQMYKNYKLVDSTSSCMRRIIVGLFCLMHTDSKIQSEQFKRTLDHKYCLKYCDPYISDGGNSDVLAGNKSPYILRSVQAIDTSVNRVPVRFISSSWLVVYLTAAAA